jgi:hypothetical protein
MATLAAGLFWGFGARGDGLVVGVLVEVRPDVGVAGFACVGANVAGRCGRLRLLSREERKAKEQSSETDESHHTLRIKGWVEGRC